MSEATTRESEMTAAGGLAVADPETPDAEAAPERPETEAAVMPPEAPPAESAPPEPEESAPKTPPEPPSWSGRTREFSVHPRNVMGRSRPTLGPPAKAPDVPPPPSLTMPFGPAGKRRSPVVVPLLSMLTLGVYSLIWHARVNGEMADFDPRMHVRPGRSLIAVAIPWAIGLLVSVAGAGRIVLAQIGIALPFDPHFSVLQAYYLLAGILLVPYLELALGFSAVGMVMTLQRVRLVEDRAGLTSDVQVKPVESVLWLLLPVTGGLVLQNLVQRRLNTAWNLAHPVTGTRPGRA